MQHPAASFLGYYTLDNALYRVIPNPERPHSFLSEVYIKGLGFKPFPLADILEYAYVLNEVEFKKKLLKITGDRR